MPSPFIESLDFISGGGIVGGIVAAATTFGWWLRRERVEASRASNSIAANNAQTGTYEAQAAEIASVRERLSKMEEAYVAQSVQVGLLLKKITELEARLVGVSAHHDNLILCEVCVVKNDRVLTALNKVLKDHNHE